MPSLSDRVRVGPSRLFFLGVLASSAVWATIFACTKNHEGPVGPANASSVRATTVRTGSGNASAAPTALPIPVRTGGVAPGGFADMLSKVEPAVVNISAVKSGGSNPYYSPYYFWRRSPPQRVERSRGSGVIVDAGGVILTNHHVIRDAQDITVSLSDKREFRAKLIGSDPKTDIAVLKVQASGLPVLPLGDSRKVRVGDLAFAVGSPFGLSQTATFGIVSAVGRGEIGIVDYEDFIQTDAAINPGNSGGALVNSRGELIGINTAILARGGRGNQGIGFAVPTHMAKNVMDSILKSGRVVRGWLGVAIQNITPMLAKALDLSTTKGVLVGNVQSGSPAENAGLKRGDVVLGVDGAKTSSSRRLRLRIAGTPPGTVVKLEVVRGGKRVEVPVKLGALPEDSVLRRGFGSRQRMRPTRQAHHVLPGVELKALSPRMAMELGLPPGVSGILVAGVSPSSKAASSGLRRGDVIFEVNRQPVRSTRDLARAMAAAGDQVLLLIGRGDMNLYVVLEK